MTTAPPSAGLHRGEVVEAGFDPAGRPRVRIAIRSLDPEVHVWADVSSFYATSRAGALFVPEIGDHVIVGFLGGDAAAPVVLGSLYPDAVPEGWARAGASVKTIGTPERLELRLDDGERTIGIRTPSGAKIEIDDGARRIDITDGAGSRIVMGPEGIEIEAGGALTLRSAGDVTIRAAGTLSLSGSEVQVKGVSVAVSADTSCTVDGGMSASLKAGAEVRVQGAMVMIN